MVFDGFPFTACRLVELAPDQLGSRLLHPVISNVHDCNGVPRLLGSLHLGDGWHHFRRHCTAKRIEGHHVFLHIGSALLDGTPQRPRLEPHHHEKCLIRVVSLGENGVANPTAHLEPLAGPPPYYCRRPHLPSSCCCPSPRLQHAQLSISFDANCQRSPGSDDTSTPVNTPCSKLT
jgi:hypothetical protein